MLKDKPKFKLFIVKCDLIKISKEKKWQLLMM